MIIVNLWIKVTKEKYENFVELYKYLLKEIEIYKKLQVKPLIKEQTVYFTVGMVKEEKYQLDSLAKINVSFYPPIDFSDNNIKIF